MHLELITDTLSQFQPTEKMILLKEKLHKYLPDHVIGQLAPENLDKIKSYLYPISVDEARGWASNYPSFWFWLILPHSQIVRQERMKSKAMDVLQDVLDGNVADSKLAGIQLNAVKMLLSLQEKPTKNITTNNLNVSKGAGSIPKHLAKKSTGELASEIAKLTGGLSKPAVEDE